MKSVSPGLAVLLASGVTTLCRCWRVERKDGVVMGFTDHDRDLAFDSTIYRAATTPTKFRLLLGIGLFSLFAVLSVFSGSWGVAAVAAIVGGLFWMDFASREFVVTNRRVLARMGYLQPRTIELPLAKIESISFQQTGGESGPLILTGTAGTQDTFRNISRPREFYRHVQEQLDLSERRQERRGDSDGA